MKPSRTSFTLKKICLVLFCRASTLQTGQFDLEDKMRFNYFCRNFKSLSCFPRSALSGRLHLSQTPQTKNWKLHSVWVTLALRHKCHLAVIFDRTILGMLFPETMFWRRCTWWPGGCKKWYVPSDHKQICVLSCAICPTASHSLGSSFASVSELWEWLQEDDN